MSKYDFRQIDKKWQAYWKKNKSFVAEKLSDKPKYYVLDMFPYPSGKGLHVGHPLGYIATDIIARYKRIKGFNVLHPMGFDAFGLPAEQYAIQTGIHPAITTEKNTNRYLEQMETLGFHHDPECVLRTSDEDYYKWTQWIFIKLFKHWYNKEQQSAEPIETLIARFAKEGNEQVQAATSQEGMFSAAQWNAMSAKEQQDILMEYRLAYQSYATVNWCPGLGTVLANEEVKDGLSERGGFPVERKAMRQWMLRITAYADRLLEGLHHIDWPESIKAQQTNWIGRSQGGKILYAVDNPDVNESIEVFTTRPDTIFGNTFMVLAPEHPLVDKITTAEQREAVDKYVNWAGSRSERDRLAETTKTGVFTGGYAIHPFTGDKLPIWIADYVLISYGTGAIMAVPAHDERDYEFAHKYGIKIIEVISGGNIEEEAYTGKEGTLVNSDFITGMNVPDAIAAVIGKLEEREIGKGHITYRIRDVIWSRQRYWGEPTPILYKNGIAEAMAEEDLPLTLPKVESYKPSGSGESPLANVSEWVNLPDGSIRETNTMPGLAGSSWYFFRYFDAKNNERYVNKEREAYWMPVDLYIGGSEHAVGHLLYSRFWTKFLKDIGEATVEEPFQKLVNQGMIQGVSEKINKVSLTAYQEETPYIIYRDKDGQEQRLEVSSKDVFISADLVKKYPLKLGKALHVEISLCDNSNLDIVGYLKWRPEWENAIFVCKGGYWQNGSFNAFENSDAKGMTLFKTSPEVEKMSKSKYNTVNPDDICERYGADSLRLYEMFLGPLEMHKPWSTNGIEGVSRFLQRTWNLFFKNGQSTVSEDKPKEAELRALHKMLKKVEEGIDRLAFNTCVPAFMTFSKEIGKLKCTKRAIFEPFLVALSPFAPHFAEELWESLGHTSSILEARYTQWEEKYVKENMIEYPIQVNGKVKTRISFAADTSKQDIEAAVLANEKVQSFIAGRTVRKVIVVPKRIVNIVAK